MSAAHPPPGAQLARTEDIADPGALVLTFKADGVYASILLTRRGAQVFGYENVCPHAGYPLQRADGGVLIQEGRYLVCGAHGASFVLDTGACAGGPCNGDPLKRIAVEVREGAVFMLRQDPCSDRDDGAS